MNSPWYEIVDAGTSLTQGDIVLDCPLLTWNTSATPPADPQATGSLQRAMTAFRADVVVMTQACDLEYAKVRNVVLCPHLPLTRFRDLWEQAMRRCGQNPTAKAWRNTCDDIAEGHVWNHAFLNSTEPDTTTPVTEIRVVDFHDIFTVPREFLESLLIQRNQPRLRLLPPYREHMSQAFARFFMRVGLPQPLAKVW